MKFSILSCEVFKPELEKYLAKLDVKPLQIRYFDVSLHSQPNSMKERLFEELDKFDKAATHILMLCGLCGNATLGLFSNDFKLVFPRVHECISIFIGSTEKYLDFKRENPSGYFASSGWCEVLPNKELYDVTKAYYIDKYGDDDEELIDDFMEAYFEQYKAYNKFFYVDFIESGESKSKCIDCAKFMNWQFEHIKSDDSFFIDCLLQKWDNERFITLEKSQKLTASYDDKIFK